MTGQPDHACSQHSGFSSHHDDTAALGNKVRRQTTATRRNKPPSNASQGSREWLGKAAGTRVHSAPRSVFYLLKPNGTIELTYLRKHKYIAFLSLDHLP